MFFILVYKLFEMFLICRFFIFCFCSYKIIGKWLLEVLFKFMIIYNYFVIEIYV